MRRRDFLIQGSKGIVLAGFVKPSLVTAAELLKPSATTQYLVAAHSDIAAHTKEIPGQKEVDLPGSVRFLNLATNKIDEIAVPIFAHVYDQVPKQPNLFIGAVKWTNSAAVVDLQSKKMIKLVKAPGDYIFFGHTCFSTDANLVYISAHSDSLKQGGLCIYDTKEWKLQKVVSSGGLYPHECISLPGDRIAVVNGHSSRDRHRSEFTILKQKDFSVEATYLVPKLGHVQYLGDNRVLLAGYDKVAESNVVLLDMKSGALQSYHQAKGYPDSSITGEALSATSLSSGVHAITVKDNHSLVIWDPKADLIQIRKYENKTYALAEFDGQLFLTEGAEGMLHRYALPTDAATSLKEVAPAAAFANGKHMRVVKA